MAYLSREVRPDRVDLVLGAPDSWLAPFRIGAAALRRCGSLLIGDIHVWSIYT